MTATTVPNVGDKVAIRSKRGAFNLYTYGTITKVTKTGRITVKRDVNGEESTYRPNRYSEGWGNDYADVLLLTDKVRAKIAEQEQEMREEVERRKVAKQADDAKHAARSAEVKAACSGSLPITSDVALPDGSRLVTLNLPMEGDRQSYKGGFEIIFVRLRHTKDYDWKAEVEVEKVESIIAYTNGRFSSFGSCSSTKHDTEEEALWEALKHRYFNW